MNEMDYETRHRVAMARELTAMAGCPLRDRYGFAASDEDVANVVRIVFREPGDREAADAIGLGNATGLLEIAMGCDTPADEQYELAIARALRPLTDQRRRAAERALCDAEHVCRSCPGCDCPGLLGCSCAPGASRHCECSWAATMARRTPT